MVALGTPFTFHYQWPQMAKTAIDESFDWYDDGSEQGATVTKSTMNVDFVNQQTERDRQLEDYLSKLTGGGGNPKNTVGYLYAQYGTIAASSYAVITSDGGSWGDRVGTIGSTAHTVADSNGHGIRVDGDESAVWLCTWQVKIVGSAGWTGEGYAYLGVADGDSGYIGPKTGTSVDEGTVAAGGTCYVLLSWLFVGSENLIVGVTNSDPSHSIATVDAQTSWVRICGAS